MTASPKRQDDVWALLFAVLHEIDKSFKGRLFQWLASLSFASGVREKRFCQNSQSRSIARNISSSPEEQGKHKARSFDRAHGNVERQVIALLALPEKLARLRPRAIPRRPSNLGPSIS